MGGLGLFACGAAAAALRKAMLDTSSFDDYAVIAGVLTFIGLLCVGVSSWNLYVRWGKGD
jgi:lysozyme